MVTPKSETIEMYLKLDVIIFQLAINCLIASGNRITVATVHLQNAKLIGGMLLFKSLAIIKLPDQIAVATSANK